jgi:hypothetical protein
MTAVQNNPVAAKKSLRMSMAFLFPVPCSLFPVT